MLHIHRQAFQNLPKIQNKTNFLKPTTHKNV